MNENKTWKIDWTDYPTGVKGSHRVEARTMDDAIEAVADILDMPTYGRLSWVAQVQS